jgi:hypothetical protein
MRRQRLIAKTGFGLHRIRATVDRDREIAFTGKDSSTSATAEHCYVAIGITRSSAEPASPFVAKRSPTRASADNCVVAKAITGAKDGDDEGDRQECLGGPSNGSIRASNARAKRALHCKVMLS